MRDGDFVRHTMYPEWGFGRVLECLGDGKCSVRFEDGTARQFSLATSDGKLVAATADQLAPSSHLRQDEWRKAPSAKSKAISCTHCKGLLRQAQYTPARDWKSCPRCSTRHGTEHVYRRYPDEFAPVEERVGEEPLEGTESYCKTCRKGRRPSLTQAVLCSAMATQEVVAAAQ